MKRIYSFMFAAVALLAAASCQKEMANELGTEGNPFSFTATIGTGTKTVLVEGNKVNWSVGDNISVFDNENTPKTFKGQHTEETATAVFNADDYTPAEAIYAIYPAKADATFDGTKIDNLRIANTQEAVAGSFDPNYAVLVGTETEKGSGLLDFKNVHALLKFTIGGESAPSSVTLTNNGDQAIAGLFAYNPATPNTTYSNNWSDEAKTITLTPKAGGSFEIGQTYYIVFRGGCNLNNLTLAFDGEVVKVKTMTIYYEATPTMGKIFNMGTVEKASAVKTPSVSMQTTKVLSKESTGGTSWLTSLDGGVANMDRNAAFDGTNVYIANVKTDTPAIIYAIPLANPENVAKVNTTGVSGGHFPISCVRTIANGEEQILIASSMGGVSAGQAVNVYAWDNGIANAPTIMMDYWTSTAGRRWGDQFTVCGDWTKGELWFRSQASNTTARWNIKNGTISNTNNLPEGWGGLGVQYLGSVYRYSMTDPNILVVPGSTEASLYNLNTSVETKLKHSYGFIGGLTPFTYNDKKFIAYVSLDKQNGTIAKLIVIEDTDGNLETALNDNLVVFEAIISSEGNTVSGGNSGMSCNVVTVGSKTYIFGHAQNIGFAVYEVTGLTEL